ncbi:MAG: 2-hydroxychromene-2-carboxylate isomerase [Burkholderiales bacterium]|nr:2-hydroxychromene-2-carboxylate isomerase [Burkholderiales bacterium]
MKSLVFWFDPISPFAYLAFERLPQALEGCSHVVEYKPVLLPGLLAHWGQKGPAEFEPKRAWTFRHVHWLAHEAGIDLQTPAEHPFNPLALLRLTLAAGPNRRVVEAVLHHVWRGGAEANDPARLAALEQQLAPELDPRGDEVKRRLRENTEAALARGVFGVPTIELEGRLFWGLDALPMVAAALRGDAWFDGPAWEREGAPRRGVKRS